MSQERDPFLPLPHVWGSFDSRESAHRLVTETLRANLDGLQALVQKPAKKAVLIQKTFDEVTGREAFRPHLGAQPEIRETKGVTSVLVRTDESDYGYHIVTSYPSTPTAPNQRMKTSGPYRQGQIHADAYDVSALMLNEFHDYYQSGEDWLADFARFAAIGRNRKSYKAVLRLSQARITVRMNWPSSGLRILPLTFSCPNSSCTMLLPSCATMLD